MERLEATFGRNSSPRWRRRELLRLDTGPASSSDHWIRVHRPAMACRFEIVLGGEDAKHVNAARRALDDAHRLEAALTVFRDTSELVHVNQFAAQQPVPVSRELFDLLALCHQLHVDTAGAFDITTTPLSRCWGFLYRQGRMPSCESIDAAAALVGMHRVELDQVRQTVAFSTAGMELNLGSIGKGFAVERIARILRGRRVRHALVSAGASSVRAVGGRGRGWQIDIRSRLVSRPLASIHLKEGALGTSGAAEQFVEIGGRRYGHIIDPRTAWPAAGVLSASVVTADAARADALATAFFVGGVDVARSYCERVPETLALVTPDDGSERPQVFGGYAGAILEDL
jgi:FAD:protein FMN transferase